MIIKLTAELHEEVLLTRGVHDDQNLVRPRQVQILFTNSISTDGNIPLRLFVHDVSILLMTLASFRLPCSSGEVQQTEVDLLPGRCFQRPMLRLGSASETRLNRTGKMHRIFGHRHETRSILLHNWNTDKFHCSLYLEQGSNCEK